VTGRVAALVAGVVLIVVVLIVLLVSGGTDAPSKFHDPSGDVAIADGDHPPRDTTLADVVEADVSRDGDELVFRAVMSDDIPARVQNGSLAWRWDVYVGGTGAWILSADLDVGANASLTSTETNYGSGTIDDTLPGDIEVDGKTFPDDFTWTLGTTLDGDRGNPTSALATDTAPDEGRGRLGD
jgi:hypothetical protein